MTNAPKLFRGVRQVHMVGIGGAGMCGIAEILLNLGFKVSGSDLQQTEVTDRLADLGVKIHQGHSADHLETADVVVFSSAVRPENVEVRRARELHIPTIPRSEMLAELMRLKQGIAVAGTHGKTTVTSMIGAILQQADLNPTIIVGGKVRALGSGARMGTGELLVAEADEYDRSFLKLSPTLAVITTIETEHLDTYSDIEDIKDAFVEFANKLPFYGALIACGDDPGVRDVLPRIKRQIVTFGMGEGNDFRATNIHHHPDGVQFELPCPSGKCVEFKLKMPGEHNILNALAAIAIAAELEITLASSQKALEQFTGIHRRFEIKRNDDNLIVVDDYAHHPTEITQTLRTARACWPERRIIALFQPHLFTRTRDFADEFGTALSHADCVMITEIFGARERAIEGVSSKLIADSVSDDREISVTLLPGNDVETQVRELLEPKDVLVVMGAGSITHIADALAQNDS